MGRYASNRYERWTDDGCTGLIALLRIDRPLGEIADRIGRGAVALDAQLKKWIPAGWKFGKRETEAFVRDLLRARDFDWLEALREHAVRSEQFYWDTEMNATLQNGWQRARPLCELTEELEASEFEVVRQLMRLGLAENAREVAERLGCDAQGILACRRLRLAEDRAEAAVWVLVVGGAKGTSPIPNGVERHRKSLLHISVHLDHESAEGVLEGLLHRHLVSGGRLSELTVAIVERSVAHLDVGADIDVSHSRRLVAGARDCAQRVAAPTDCASGSDSVVERERRRHAVPNGRGHAPSRAEGRADAGEFRHQAVSILVEAVERLRDRTCLELLLVRRKRRFEWSSDSFTTDQGESRYVVLERRRCWMLPRFVSLGAAGEELPLPSMLLTEQAELVYLDSNRIISTAQPRTIAVTEPPCAVEISEHFSSRSSGLSGHPVMAELDLLRNTLSRCYVEHDQGPVLPVHGN